MLTTLSGLSHIKRATKGNERNEQGLFENCILALKIPRDFVSPPVMKQVSVCLFCHFVIISFET